jgi:tRNA-dihydrouridine synthase 4
MIARGALTNPALFTGAERVPISCICSYFNLAQQFGGSFRIDHHHLMFMLSDYLSKMERKQFNELRSLVSIQKFFEQRNWIDTGTSEQTSKPNFEPDIFTSNKNKNNSGRSLAQSPAQHTNTYACTQPNVI